MSSIQPTSQSSRIPSLDFLRGIAVLGILFINIENFAYPDSWSPWKYGFECDIDKHIRFWVYFLTQGKFYTMFALLFGVGFYVFLERLEKKNIGLRAMDIYARRLLWLFIIGNIHAYFIWDGDVLYHYAICGFLLFPFRSMSNRSLIFVVGVLTSIILSNNLLLTSKRIASYEKYILAKEIPQDQWSAELRDRNAYWQSKLSPKYPGSATVKTPKQAFADGLADTYHHSEVHKGVIYHSSLLFPSLLIMIIGIMLYRSGIFHDYQIWKNYWVISMTLLAIGLTINYQRYYHWTYLYYNPVLSYWKSAIFCFPKEILGIGYILIINGLYQRFLKDVRIKIFSKIGRMALTNYICQSILLGLIFYGYGFGKFNQFSRFDLVWIVLITWIFQIVFSLTWLTRFNQGPLEWIWRKLTYRRLDPKSIELDRKI